MQPSGMGFSFLFLLFFFSYQSSFPSDGYSVKVSLSKPISGYAVLQELLPTAVKGIDSVKLNNQTSFSFSGKVNEPGFYRIKLSKKDFILFILDNVPLQIEVTGEIEKGGYTITGSQDNQYLTKVNQMSQFFDEEYRQLSKSYEAAADAGNNEVRRNIEEKFRDFLTRKNTRAKALIREMNTSVAVFYALNLIDNQEEEFSFLDSLARKFEKIGSKLPYVQMFITKINTQRKLAIGQPAPEISLSSPSGKIILLSSLKGKYVLIDFWASWCGPCRQENPNVVRLYEKYKAKNFEIYGVSLDRDKESWVKAIEKDKLKWIHVSDLQYWNSAGAAAYQVRSIPSTYLVDPHGFIIGKNLRGATLEAKLSELLLK
jgi:thiol-disulfide isomerase/thioredoxin